jgi:membrane fusion protein, multidrug efflux system
MTPSPTRLLAVVALFLAVASSACRSRMPDRSAAQQEAMAAVGAEPAQTAGIRAVVRASGVVVPAEGAEFQIVAPEPARIVEIAKAPGDAVRSGEVLVRFDLPSASRDVARFAAELAGAEAQLENARIAQARARDFVERGLLPRRDAETADRDLADAQMAAEKTRAAHAAAEASAARSAVRSPFDGLVAGRWHIPGDLVQPTSSDPVLRVVDPRRLEVTASIAAADIARVLPGATARIAGAADARPVRLTVASRLPTGSAGPEGATPVRLVFEEPTMLAVDTRVEVEIDAEERSNAVLVPREALVQEGNQTIIMVATGGKAERRVITTGIVDDQRIEIVSGVTGGELVITRGHIGLPDGAAISVAVRGQ